MLGLSVKPHSKYQVINVKVTLILLNPSWNSLNHTDIAFPYKYGCKWVMQKSYSEDMK